MNEKVRRADLYLRARYPHLDTKIFKLSNGFYAILLNDFTGNFDDIQKEFDYAIKPITTPVTLYKNMPNNVEEELPIIKDTEIGDNFSGLPLTLPDLKYLLLAKFPMIEIIHLESYDRERKLNVYTNIIPDISIKERIIDFLYGLDIPMDFTIIENASDGIAKENDENEKRKAAFLSIPNKSPIAKVILDSFDDPIMRSLPTKLNKTRFIYEERDEQMWFEKLGEIYAGNFTKTNIRNGINTYSSCYIDYSLFNNVNIRNGIVLYDKIFIEPPVDSDIKTFCSIQKVNSDEIIQLCKENKVIFILPQPSFRYDFDFLNELYKINPNCILSRRALSALIICDLVEINKNYFIKTMGIADCVYEISEIIREIDKSYEKADLYNIFMWPQKALRSALEVFLFGSTYKVAVFGINNLFTDMLNEEQKKEIELEFVINSDKVHLSSALNSQYFPHFENFEGKMYSNRTITSIMGNMLNFYKNSSFEKIKQYVIERGKIITDKSMLPVSLIEVDEYISVAEINTLSKTLFSSDNFNSILEYLHSLSSHDMEKKINEYNELVKKEINKRKNISSFIDFSLTAGMDALGPFIPIPFVSTGLKIIESAIKRTGITKTKKIEKIREAFFKIGQNYDEKKAISFLSKINSVARLRKKYD